MTPALKQGDVVLARRRLPNEGEIAIALYGSREVIKRVERKEGSEFYLVGDNRHESTDSRHYGKLNESAILGTIMIVLPRSVDPPKLVKPYGLWLGRIVAAILVIMTLVHLFRIDTIIPIIDSYMPGGSVAASFITLFIITSELFAIPFALRMKLSPLAHLKSGALIALAPLWWVLISIWTLGLPVNTGQLGEFVFVPSSSFVLLLNVIWLGLNYYTLYTLGYNRLHVRDVLRK